MKPKRKLGFYPRKKIPSYEVVAEKLSTLFKEHNWNWGDKIIIYEGVKTFVRSQFYRRKGKGGFNMVQRYGKCRKCKEHKLIHKGNICDECRVKLRELKNL